MGRLVLRLLLDSEISDSVGQELGMVGGTCLFPLSECPWDQGYLSLGLQPSLPKRATCAFVKQSTGWHNICLADSILYPQDIFILNTHYVLFLSFSSHLSINIDSHYAILSTSIC